MSVTISFSGCSEDLEMNLSNHNFHSFFRRLGVSPDLMEADPNHIFNLCKSFDPKTLLEDSYSEKNFYHCGRTLEQVTKYKWRLMRLATEAIKQDKSIVWY
jgi:hypothetical protein